MSVVVLVSDECVLKYWDEILEERANMCNLEIVNNAVVIKDVPNRLGVSQATVQKIVVQKIVT